LARRREPRRGQARAQQCERMPPEGEAERGVVRGDTFGFGGRGDERTALPEIGAAGAREAERHGALGGDDLPEREVAVAAERRERPGRGERLEVAAVERRAGGEVLHARKGLLGARRRSEEHTSEL